MAGASGAWGSKISDLWNQFTSSSGPVGRTTSGWPTPVPTPTVYATEPKPQTRTAEQAFQSQAGTYSMMPNYSVLGAQTQNQPQPTPVGTPAPQQGQPSGGGGEQPGYYVEQPPQEDYGGMAQEAYGKLEGIFNEIEADYQKQLPATEESIKTRYGQAKEPFREAQTEELGGLETRRIAEQGREKGAIAQSRSLYNELRQQRMGELSAGGLSSSSVAEAQMEKLGRSVYQDIGVARKQAAETYRQIEAEETNVGKYYTRKIQEVDDNLTMALDEARMRFNDKLAEIKLMRGKAGVEFAQEQSHARYEAMQAYRQEAIQIQQYNSGMKLKLEEWATEKLQKVQEEKRKVAQIDSPEYYQNYLNQAKQYGLVPQSISVTHGKAPTWKFGTAEADDEENLFKE